MSSLSQFQMAGGGGKLRFAEFLVNGTFTPSAALIANGGQVFYEGAGGGGGGGGYYADNGGNQINGGGGGSSFNRGLLTLTTPQAVTIGTGGAGKNFTGLGIIANGNDGTATTLGSLLTIYGGGGGGAGNVARSLGKAAHLGRPGTAPTYISGIDSIAGQGGGEGGGSPATSGTANSGGGGGGGTNGAAGGNGGSGYLRLWWYE